MSAVTKRKDHFQTIFCAPCNCWTTDFYFERHLRSIKHRKNKYNFEMSASHANGLLQDILSAKQTKKRKSNTQHNEPKAKKRKLIDKRTESVQQSTESAEVAQAVNVESVSTQGKSNDIIDMYANDIPQNVLGLPDLDKYWEEFWQEEPQSNAHHIEVVCGAPTQCQAPQNHCEDPHNNQLAFLTCANCNPSNYKDYLYLLK